MPVCETVNAVGDSYRLEWQRDGGDERFGSSGELLESVKPHRAVTTEVINEMTLTEVGEGTVLSVVITYANVQQRDSVLATGMTDGMETSFQRLERLLQQPLA